MNKPRHHFAIYGITFAVPSLPRLLTGLTLAGTAVLILTLIQYIATQKWDFGPPPYVASVMALIVMHHAFLPIRRAPLNAAIMIAESVLLGLALRALM